ncbi:hypothetical protein [Methylobacterium aerolatum]|uniref:MarR family transcriptional regulator n=1 Tax=Methylobacterium aerolatum TaxID=418708 RepID=A0ABU0HYV9_9HYPH|nr:hypothetical protein [Methylobacterium aerolatum]MDQ0447534.1 hypothetical protein [Methylobacterium aerolatum]
MPERTTPSLWWQLTPAQRTMLRRLHMEGPLPMPDHSEMRTVRSLVRRGLLRTRDRGRDRASEPGCWFLTARAARLVQQAEGAVTPAREEAVS